MLGSSTFCSFFLVKAKAEDCWGPGLVVDVNAGLGNAEAVVVLGEFGEIWFKFSPSFDDCLAGEALVTQEGIEFLANLYVGFALFFALDDHFI